MNEIELDGLLVTYKVVNYQGEQEVGISDGLHISIVGVMGLVESTYLRTGAQEVLCNDFDEDKIIEEIKNQLNK